MNEWIEVKVEHFLHPFGIPGPRCRSSPASARGLIDRSTMRVILWEDSLHLLASSPATSFPCLLPLPHPVCAQGMQTNLTKAKHN